MAGADLPLALGSLEQRQDAEAGSDGRMVLAQFRLLDLQAAPGQGLRLGVLSHRLIEGGEVVEGQGDVGVVLAPPRLLDLQAALQQGQGLGVLARLPVEGRQIVQGGRDVGVVLAQFRLHDLQGAPIQRLRLGVLARVPVERRQVVEGEGDGGVFLAQFCLLDLQAALAYEIAPVGQGLKAMMTALGCSRAHNSMGAAGVMRRAYMESLCWAANRETFGKKLIERPMIQKRILDIALQWMAGSALAFEAARSFDDAAKDSGKEPWMRIVTALAKFRTAEQAVWCAQKALELVGGNGYTEDYATARQFRDAMVLPVWEGPEQIQALELMRMIAGAEPGDRLFLEKIASARDLLPAAMNGEKINLSTLAGIMEDSFKKLRAEPQKAELVADEFLGKMSDILTYALLCEEAAWEYANKNDGTKLLVCRAYHARVWPGEFATPSFSPGALLRHFNQIVQAEPIPPGPGSNWELHP